MKQIELTEEEIYMLLAAIAKYMAYIDLNDENKTKGYTTLVTIVGKILQKIEE